MDKWWNFHPIIAPLPRGFMDDDRSHKEAKEWMNRATDEIERLHAREALLREALLFYATENNWLDGKTDRTPSGAIISTPDSVAKDFGDKARAALAEQEAR